MCSIKVLYNTCTCTFSTIPKVVQGVIKIAVVINMLNVHSSITISLYRFEVCKTTTMFFIFVKLLLDVNIMVYMYNGMRNYILQL